MTDVCASTRDANTVFATFNNYQRGDFKPYVYKSVDRGRTWTSIAGNLPQRSGAWSIVQDHVNGDLLFAGMEFGVWFTVDGGANWTQLKGGIPTTQARDLQIQRRENDLVVGTFGRGAYILDDYSALRGVTAQALTRRCAALPAARRVHLQRARSVRAPRGATSRRRIRRTARVFTYHVGQAPAADAKLVLSIADDAGRPVRRLDLAERAGLQRIAWNLRGEPPAGGGRGGAVAARAASRGDGGEQQDEPPVFGGRGGRRRAAGCARALSRHARTPRGRHRHAHRRATDRSRFCRCRGRARMDTDVPRASVHFSSRSVKLPALRPSS